MNDTYLYGEMFSENILTSYRIYGDRKFITTPLIILLTAALLAALIIY